MKLKLLVLTYIGYADRNKKYDLIKQVAESNNVKDWECPVMKTYYEGGYDK